MKKVLSVILSFVLLFSFSLCVFAAEKPFENSRFFEIGDYSIHYRVFEPAGESKNQIMLIHGFGLSTASFEGLAEEYVKSGYKVVLADMPSFGYSSREDENTDLLDREYIVYSLMNYLSSEKWIIGGHSMGGGIALNTAASYPEKISAVVLFAPQTNAPLTGIQSKLVSSFPVKTAFGAIIKLASKLDFLIRIAVAFAFSDISFAKTYDTSKVSDPLALDGTGKGFAIMTTHVKSVDFEGFSELEVPCIIITSSTDRVADKTNLKTIIDSSPEGTVVKEVDFGGHMMMEYDPVACAALTMPIIEAA